MKISEDRMEKTLQDGGHRTIIVRPGLCCVFYVSKPLRDIARAAAEVLRMFISYIPPNALRSYYASNGGYKKLTPARLSKDISRLSDLPRGYVGQLIDYSGGENGNVGDYALFFQAFELSELVDGEVGILRLEFPHDFVDSHGAEAFSDFVYEIANMFPFQSGNVGYSFKGSRQRDAFSYAEIFKLLPRYLGFDAWYTDLRYDMAGCAPTAHWMNLLDTVLLQRVGGMAALTKVLPGADIRELKEGVFIRTAQLPPIGDSNRMAKDIGLLPEIARLMKCLRSPARTFVGRGREFDAQAWFARFDDMQSRPWS